jgi:signal transduction histidine kinase
VAPAIPDNCAGGAAVSSSDPDELRRSRRRLVAAAENDRRAIERALHDGLQQQLVALAMSIQRLRMLIDSDDQTARSMLEETATVVQQAIDEAGRLAKRIYPPLLDQRGLAGSLRSAAVDTGIRLSIDMDPAARYAPQVTAALYWTCVEAISSAPPDTNVTVTVHQGEGTIEFEVVSVGDYTAQQVERLRDRVEAMGGRLKVGTVGKNARLAGWLPAGEDRPASRRRGRPRQGTRSRP